MSRNTYLEVNLGTFENNLRNIKGYIGNKDVLPVIKANAYGLGVNKILEVVNKLKIKMVCVALVQEGIHIRELGYKGDIFILNPFFASDIEDIVTYTLTPGVSNVELVKQLDKYVGKMNKQVKIHLEIETGMGRTGINKEDLMQDINNICKLNNIVIDGAYTHFSTSDEQDTNYLDYQIKNFEDAVNVIKSYNIRMSVIHMSNSGAVLRRKDDFTTAIRPGLLMYGYNISEDVKNVIDVKPVATLSSCISFLKKVNEGISLGYGRKYITKGEAIIATVPIGYADGIPRTLSNKGKVVVNGCICDIVGNICMDSFLVDVTKVKDVKLEDKVYIWDNDKIYLESVANTAGTINYEILSRISERVERKYINNL